MTIFARTTTFSLIVRLISLFLLLACCVGAAPEQRTDRIIVKPKPGHAIQVSQAHKKFGARIHRQFNALGGLQVIALPRGMKVEKALAHYRKLGLFEYAQPDYVRRIVAMPDDPSFGSLYGLVNIGCTNAWDIRTNAETIIVAVIDTGTRLDHEDLVSNLWSNPCLECPVNGIVYSNDLHGINAITGTGDPTDDHGHGTHVAGTVGAAGNNSLGVCGVAWRVQLMPLKFISASNVGYDSDAVECIEYAIAKGADILSNSWGGYGDSPAIYDAIRHARDAGIIFVAAAGNDNTNIDGNPFIPAGFDLDNIVSVAATDSGDNRAGFSNYGRDSVDLGAPGASILSTYHNATNAYTWISGTSMATPHVAGAFALVKAEFPGETYTQLIHRVLGTVDPLPALSNLTVTGGRLNVNNAFTQSPRPLADFSSTPRGGYSIDFANQTLGTITNLTWDFGDGSPLSSVWHPSHTYTSAGTYTVTLNVNGPTGDHQRSHSVTVGNNYYLRAAPFEWLDPTGMTSIALTDESTSSDQTLPFDFALYGQTNNTFYIGSNGLLVFNPDSLINLFRTKLPSSGVPTNVIAPYWADLDPGVGGLVYVGTTGAAPNRIEVISWVGVPSFNDTNALFTFQALLHETTHDIVFQYQEIQPTNLLYGAGHKAAIGIEDNTSTFGRQCTAFLTNNQALLFTRTPPTPTLTGPASPATNLTLQLTGTTEPLATVVIGAFTNTADATGAYYFTITVETNSLNNFAAQATDTAGNPTALSTNVTYRHLAPDDDPDGDGVTNLNELDAGTDPLAPASYPHILSILPVTIESVSNKTYQLEVCDDLPSGLWTNFGDAVLGDGSILTLPDAADVPQRFYRVKISP